MNLPVVKKHLALFLLLLVLLFSACTKIVTTDLGGDLIPPVDGVNTKEMYLDVSSINGDTTVARVGIGFDHALGYVNDPLFGKITASVNVQLKPTFPLIWPASKDSMYIDSVVMVLGYSGVWGDSTQPLYFRVYDLTNDDPDTLLHSDSVYQTNYFVPHGVERTDKLDTVYPAALNDSVKPFMEQAINQVRLKLSNSYGSYILGLDSSHFTNDSVFSQLFKGYQIAPQQAGNALLRVNLLDTNTKLAIYFRYRKGGSLDTAVRYFRANSYTSGSSNFIVHDRTGSGVEKWLNHVNSTNDSEIFIATNPGIEAKLQIPGLASLQNMIIHRAEILMEQIPDLTNPAEKYFTPPNLFLAPFTGDSMRRFGLPNDVQYGTGYVSNQYALGCFPYTKTDSASHLPIYAYRFDISRYVQGIVTRHDSAYNLVLYAPYNDYIYTQVSSPYTAFTGPSTSTPLNPGPAIGRIRLGGGNNTAHKMRVHIVYSDIFK